MTAVVVALVGFYTVRLAAALRANAAVAQAMRTDRIQRFMLRLFDGGEKGVGSGRHASRRDDRADRGVLEARAARSANRSSRQSGYAQTLGGVYEKLGKLDQRRVAFQRLARYPPRRSRPSSTASDVVRGTTPALALLRSIRRDSKRADSLGREAVTAARSALAPEDPEVANATAALGQILEQRGLVYAQAITAPLQQASRPAVAPGRRPIDRRKHALRAGEHEFLCRTLRRGRVAHPARARHPHRASSVRPTRWWPRI